MIDETKKGLGAEHLVDQERIGDANKTCPECLGHGGWNLHDGEESRKTCPTCHGTGKAPGSAEQTAPTTADDPVLKAIDAAKWSEIEFPDNDADPNFAHAINGANIQIEAIRTAYLEIIAKRDEAQATSDELMQSMLDERARLFSRISELEAQLKPSDGLAFDRTVIGYMPAKFPVKKMVVRTSGIEHMLCRLTEAHTADRAADRAEIERLKADKAELVDALRYKCGRMSVTERIEGEWGWDNRAEKILTKHTEAKP